MGSLRSQFELLFSLRAAGFPFAVLVGHRRVRRVLSQLLVDTSVAVLLTVSVGHRRGRHYPEAGVAIRVAWFGD